MSGPEIRARIERNNKIILDADFTKFQLNKEVADAIEENRRLRLECEHEYDEHGNCKWCFREENE